MLQDVCKKIIERWSEAQNAGTKEKKEGIVPYLS